MDAMEKWLKEKTEHAKNMLDVETIVAHAQMLSEGMSLICVGTNDKNYVNMAVGAFGVLSVALNNAYVTISDAGTDYVHNNGLQYPIVVEN